mmetsp:Transcript_28822/g.92635  ORF Transcript_28822/g.92635 Transcript_28822/m.92635 type:complete len:97 (-) Transcript_28822:64-354(-)
MPVWRGQAALASRVMMPPILGPCPNKGMYLVIHVFAPAEPRDDWTRPRIVQQFFMCMRVRACMCGCALPCQRFDQRFACYLPSCISSFTGAALLFE